MIKYWDDWLVLIICIFLNEYERYFCVVKRIEDEIEKIKKDYEKEIKR